jgi:hypothetical protein
MTLSSAGMGEKCAFCQTDMNVGASVCRSCGAERHLLTRGGGTVGQYLVVIAWLPLVVGIFPAILFTGELLGGGTSKDKFAAGVFTLIFGGGGFALRLLGKLLMRRAGTKVTYIK